jgi:hypothetical protein
MICGESEEYLWVTSLVAVAADGFVRRWAGGRERRGVAWRARGDRVERGAMPRGLLVLPVSSRMSSRDPLRGDGD